ncbi:hypothetical protein U1Q18_003381, partial [Sarracenia purpurea var. burkii]
KGNAKSAPVGDEKDPPEKGGREGPAGKEVSRENKEAGEGPDHGVSSLGGASDFAPAADQSDEDGSDVSYACKDEKTSDSLVDPDGVAVSEKDEPNGEQENQVLDESLLWDFDAEPENVRCALPVEGYVQGKGKPLENSAEQEGNVMHGVCSNHDASLPRSWVQVVASYGSTGLLIGGAKLNQRSSSGSSLAYAFRIGGYRH